MKQVTVKDLLEVLRTVPEDCIFTVWMNGERLNIVDIDDSFTLCRFVELNVEKEEA